MEIQQIFNAVFGSFTNIIAAIVITSLTLLALFGTFSKSSNHKIRHFARQSPAILATVGIFFSFWGISIGLIGLDLNDIQNSIPKLLDGLKVKFIASLMGIGASIIVRIAQNFAVEDIIEKDNDEKIVGLLTDIKNVLANSANSSPEALLQELKEEIGKLPIEFEKQTVLLESIKTSLVGDGEASLSTKLDKVRFGVVDALNSMDLNNKQRDNESNQVIKSGFDNLTQEFKNFAEKAAENNTKAIMTALQETMRDFNKSLGEQFGENFKRLDDSVGKLLTWQENYKNHVDKLNDNFEIAIKSIMAIQIAFGDIQTRSESFAGVSTELSGILQKLDSQLQEFDAYLKGISLIANNAKDAFPIIHEQVLNLTEGFKASTEQSLNSIKKTVEVVGNDLGETTRELSVTTKKLRDSVEKTSDEFESVVSDTLRNLEKGTKANIETYQTAVSEQLESMTVSIKKGNTLVDETIQRATDGFGKSISETGAVLKASTDTVANHLTSATDAMKGMIENQQSALNSTSTEFKTIVNQTLHDLSEKTQASIQNYQESLQQAVTKQLDSIDANIQKSNSVVNSTIQNVCAEFENAIKAQSDSMNRTISTASDSFKTAIQDTAKDFEVMAESIAASINVQEKTLIDVSHNVKITVDKTLRDLTEQSQLAIKEYESSLHNIIMSQFNTVKDSVNAASKDFNRLLAENTEKSTSVLVQQTQLLDTALQEELKKAIETMGKHLAALSNQFVQDYRPLTEKLREVVKLAEDLKLKGR